MSTRIGYVCSVGIARCEVAPNRRIAIPIVPGIFKHLACEDLPGILQNPVAARKYTVEALRVAPWQVLREFDRRWLTECLDRADLTAGRRAALEFMLRL